MQACVAVCVCRLPVPSGKRTVPALRASEIRRCASGETNRNGHVCLAHLKVGPASLKTIGKMFGANRAPRDGRQPQIVDDDENVWTRGSDVDAHWSATLNDRLQHRCWSRRGHFWLGPRRSAILITRSTLGWARMLPHATLFFAGDLPGQSRGLMRYPLRRHLWPAHQWKLGANDVARMSKPSGFFSGDARLSCAFQPARTLEAHVSDRHRDGKWSLNGAVTARYC